MSRYTSSFQANKHPNSLSHSNAVPELISCMNSNSGASAGKRSRSDYDYNESNELSTNACSTKRLRALSNCTSTFGAEQAPLQQLGVKRKLANTDHDDDFINNGSSLPANEASSNLAQSPSNELSNNTSSWVKRLRANSPFTGYDNKLNEDRIYGDNTRYLPHGNNTRILSMDTWEPLPPLANHEVQSLNQTGDAHSSSSSSMTLVPWSGKVSSSPRLPDKIILPSSSENWWCPNGHSSPLSMRYWPSSNYREQAKVGNEEAESNDDHSKYAMVLYRPDDYYPTMTHYGDDDYHGPIIEELSSEDSTGEEQDQVVDMNLD
ncbi:hypothetical protein BDF22DRAFT_685172 [Syncephalis plumigaleata]|nr:hypothetical protein BDF22DRAFT_685172 [Syncephalis plumigaleata]